MAGSIARQRSVRNSFDSLRENVRRTLLEGQAKIERARVETYWKTGKLIHEHILENKERADYGRQIIQKLGSELEVSPQLLYQTWQFYEAFPKLRTCVDSSNHLSWSHFRRLAVVHDENARLDLLSRARKRKWSTVQLSEKIKEERGLAPVTEEPKVEPEKEKGAVPRLVPKLGALYTYRLEAARRVNAREDETDLRVDLGFENQYLLTPEQAKGFREGQVVRSVKDARGDYSIEKCGLKQDALFTYRADVERVVDGDTLIVVLDLGFRIVARHYLRLRGIDCAEVSTANGRRAKAFVEAKLKEAEYLIVTSTKSDKYGRYLADLHVPVEGGEPQFLNQLLLNERLAVRVHG